MREQFKQFNPLSEHEFSTVWNECLFVFDTNVLLDLYRYSQKTMEDFISVLSQLKPKLWLPHQVALEFFSNRNSVILEQKDAYISIKSLLSEIQSGLLKETNSKLKDYKRHHPLLDIDELIEKTSIFFNTLILEVEQKEDQHPDLSKKDTVLESILKIFDGFVGEPYTIDEINNLHNEGKNRYEKLIPPGYQDADKKTKKHFNELIIEDKYGDFIVWKQILQKAKTDQKSVIFVTGDSKEDWWLKVRGRVIGPRHELINEFFHETNKIFHMYQPDRFLSFAQNHLKNSVNNEAVKEIQSLLSSKENEIEFYNDKVKMRYEEKINSPIELTDSGISFIIDNAISQLNDSAAEQLTKNAKNFFESENKYEINEKVRHPLYGVGSVTRKYKAVKDKLISKFIEVTFNNYSRDKVSFLENDSILTRI